MRGSGQDQVDVGATKEALQEREARLRSILETVAASWIAAFALFLVFYAPLLLSPRTDGKPG